MRKLIARVRLVRGASLQDESFCYVGVVLSKKVSGQHFRVNLAIIRAVMVVGWQ